MSGVSMARRHRPPAKRCSQAAGALVRRTTSSVASTIGGGSPARPCPPRPERQAHAVRSGNRRAVATRARDRATHRLPKHLRDQAIIGGQPVACVQETKGVRRSITVSLDRRPASRNLRGPSSGAAGPIRPHDPGGRPSFSWLCGSERTALLSVCTPWTWPARGGRRRAPYASETPLSALPAGSAAPISVARSASATIPTRRLSRLRTGSRRI
jgi:hypothetical protein